MTEILFHPAFWMPLLLGIAGVAVFVFGNARLKTGIRNAGVGIIALTLIWIAAAYFVDTFSEKCVTRTNAIIAAVESGRWNDLKGLLDKNTAIPLIDLRGPDDIAATTDRYATMAQLKAVHIIARDTAQTPQGVDVTIDTIMEAQQNGTSTWTFSYEQRSDGILLREILPIRFNGRSLGELERAIGKIRR
jgi:hypothetical protein